MGPTLYISRCSCSLKKSRWRSRPPDHPGPGRTLWICRSHPPEAGSVPALMPRRRDLWMVRSGGMTLAALRRRLDRRLEEQTPAPGRLRARIGGDWLPVQDGDTLVCVCSTRAGRLGFCHRAWIVPHLALAGWNIIFDGQPLAAWAIATATQEARP